MKNEDPVFKNLDPHNFPKKTWPFILFCVQGFLFLMVAAFITIAIYSVIQSLQSYAIGSMIDRIEQSDISLGMSQVIKPFMLLASFLLIWLILEFVSEVLIGLRIVSRLQAALYWRLHRIALFKDMQFYVNEFAGRITSKMAQIVQSIHLGSGLLYDIGAYFFMNLVITLFIVIRINFYLGLLFIPWLICVVCAFIYFVPKTIVAAQNAAKKSSELSGYTADVYANIKTVKLFSHSEQEADYTRRKIEEKKAAAITRNRLGSNAQIFYEFLGGAHLLLTIYFSIKLYMTGALSVGELAMVTMLVRRLQGISLIWGNFVESYFRYIGQIQDGLQLFSVPTEILDEKNAPDLVVNKGLIAFEDVSFSYHKDQPILKNFSLTIEPGEKVGVVGLSGGGKTSLFHLLLRFYDPISGRITIDGQDIRRVTQESLRKQIGMVAQDTSLFHRTIGENIAYGKEKTDCLEIEKAAQLAGADAFIQDLVDEDGHRGYEVEVGERGAQLSGGQRQRISIARIFLKNASILLLDEATSALDSESEHEIQTHLKSLMEGKTVLAIAHRLGTIAQMDRIIVVENGMIIEDGTHEDLTQLGGRYASLWKRQTCEYLDSED